MTERLLQYIWQFRYFSQGELTSTDGDIVQIIHPGLYNTNQGPDFLDSRIRIGATIWAGNVELHIKASDWNNHKHSTDKNYQHIILHVVWENDIDLSLPFPTLELQQRISSILLKRYEELMKGESFIACQNNIISVNEMIWQSWKERLLVERLKERTGLIISRLNNNNNHWEEVFWWLLARNFGIKVNSDAFEKIALSIPVNILAKHKNQLHQVEALLFGQAGLLEDDFIEHYPGMLKKEYTFYKVKYNLEPIKETLYFLRMRPSNFPTIRLAQLAVLIFNSVHLFSKIKESDALIEVKNMLNITANDYWHYHYRFDEESVFKEKHLGAQMIDNILINTIVPIIFAYGHFHNEIKYKEKALQWMQQIKPEQNNITKGFTSLGIINSNAFDSQALIQLKNEYCNQKHCLDCAIGNKILKNP